MHVIEFPTAPALSTPRDSAPPEWSKTTLGIALVVMIITVISTIAMLRCASPELWWDEADYVAKTGLPARFLWSTADYDRHQHGPMAIYLAKIGQHVIPPALAAVDVRLRFLEALTGSFGIGLVYFLLRQCFRTVATAALVGSGLLLFSVIRLEGPPSLVRITFFWFARWRLSGWAITGATRRRCKQPPYSA